MVFLMVKFIIAIIESCKPVHEKVKALIQEREVLYFILACVIGLSLTNHGKPE